MPILTFKRFHVFEVVSFVWCAECRVPIGTLYLVRLHLSCAMQHAPPHQPIYLSSRAILVSERQHRKHDHLLLKREHLKGRVSTRAFAHVVTPALCFGLAAGNDTLFLLISLA